MEEPLTIGSTQTLTDQTMISANSDAQANELIIETGADVDKFMQDIKFRGKTGKHFYKDPKLMLFDEGCPRKLFEKETPRVDFDK